MAISAEVAAADKLREELDDDSFAAALERWFDHLSAEEETATEETDAVATELDFCRRGFECVARRLDRERESFAREPAGEGELTEADLKAIAEQLDHARMKVFLEPFFERYRSVTARAGGGLREASQAEEIGRELASLASTIGAAESLLGESETYRAFRKNVGDNLERVREAQRALGEADLINSYSERFQRLLETFKGGRRSAADVERLREGMHELEKEVAALRLAAESAQGKKSLDDLSTAIERILEQTADE